MTAAEASPVLAGCDLSMLDYAACQRYLAWLLGEKEATEPEGATGLVWALAHSDDGVTWGRHDASAKVWRLGNQAVPEVSPPIRPEALQELRLFGEAGEVLIWRTDADLRGRMLLDAGPGADRPNESDSLRPSDESRILRGEHVVERSEHGFSHVGDRTGAEQVLPLEVTKEQLRAAQVRLEVRHYYESDADTGAVRIVATRLVRLTAGGSHGA
ncbi:MAG: CRISPR-associated protein Csx19 [Vicinamibacterales bacterium]